jgi:hypothetical protein
MRSLAIRVARNLIEIIIGLVLIGGTGFSAEIPPMEGKGIEKKTQEPSTQEGPKNIERLMMEGTEIQGTLEEPHVVYVIPWKELPSAPDGEISLRRSFRKEILEPVDRERFQRQWEDLSRGSK